MIFLFFLPLEYFIAPRLTLYSVENGKLLFALLVYSRFTDNMQLIRDNVFYWNHDVYVNFLVII